MARIELDSPITELKGVGESQAKKFTILGVNTIADLINFYPRRYEDYSTVTPVGQLHPGTVSIEAEIDEISSRYVRRGMHITEALAKDESGSVRLVWFNQPYRAKAIRANQKYFISGNYELRRQRFSLLNPSIELSGDLPVNAARILAVYRETKGLTSRQIRLAMAQALRSIKTVPETLPSDLIDKHKLISRSQALIAIHMPESAEQLEIARRRLGFDEVLRLSLASLLNKQENQSETALSIPFQEKLAKEFVGHLPFSLTDSQRRTIWQIYLDLQKEQPMNRLLEGDVGSGKTAVAAYGFLVAKTAGLQSAFLVPTEILAEQHYQTLYDLLIQRHQLRELYLVL